MLFLSGIYKFTLEDPARKLFQMLRSLTLFTVLSLAVLTHAEDSESQFQKGLAAYQSSNFEEARAAFQGIISQGHETPQLLNNLALTSLKLNDKPSALALWRKALAADPKYRPARLGRDQMESDLRVRGWSRGVMDLLLGPTLEWVSFFESLWVFAALLCISFWLWLRYFGQLRRALSEELPRPGLPIGGAIVSILLLLSFFVVALKVSDRLQTRATVITTNAAARALPNDQGVSLFELRPGSEVLLRRKMDGWAQIQSSDGASGWIPTSDLFITSPN